MKKIFTVSLVAIMAATAANADIASTKYVTDRTGNTTFTGSIAESADLTVAVNALAGKVDTVAGEGEGSVAEQITSALTSYTNTQGMESAISTAVSGAKQELTTEIGKVEDKADANTEAISKLDQTYATDTALTDGLALKQDVANIVQGIETNKTADDKYPSAKAVYDYVSEEMGVLSDGIGGATTKIATLEGAVEGLGGEIDTITNETTGILAQAKADATSKADQALTDAKAYAEAQDTAQTTTITNAYKAADSALETSLQAYVDAEDKKIEDSIGTVEQGKTVVQMITEAKEAASGDAGEVASDLANYISSNNTAVAAAKKAGDDAQADLNAYKTSNNAAVAKAQTDAVASAKTYTDAEIDKVETAYAAADTALETSLQSYADQAEADAIAAAKTAGDAAYAAKSYEAIVNADKAFRESITAGTTGSDGAYALTATVTNGSVSGYKWEQIGR